jgi:hypothetical protein
MSGVVTEPSNELTTTRCPAPCFRKTGSTTRATVAVPCSEVFTTCSKTSFGSSSMVP